MRAAKILSAIEVGVALAGVGAATLGWTITRRLTAPVSGRRYDLRIHEVEQDGAHIRVVLDRTSETTATGIYNLWFEHGGWAQLGPEIEDRGTDRIARTVTGIPGGLEIQPGDRLLERDLLRHTCRRRARRPRRHDRDGSRTVPGAED